ncbi:hypothetical protein BN1086_00832 [Citrobacter koseri]|uniref:Uncharacterized protein n=1 Tax=Citrobacter koseri TaxID=545 RepID=A0A078L7N7_CITKO|nr:hypothetical protein BN1086_00832 [Citrobacter koseri]
MTLFSNELQNGLVWLPELGMGRYPVPADRPYNADYFARYQAMADTSMGQQLTAARIQLVMRHYQWACTGCGDRLRSVRQQLPRRAGLRC